MKNTRPGAAVSSNAGGSHIKYEADDVLTSQGDVLVTVLPGLPLGGYLPLWHDDGRVSYWRMPDPDEVLTNLGVGALARSEVDVSRYRDAFAFNARTNEIFLMSRVRTDDRVGAARVELAPASQREADEAVTEHTVSDLYDWLGDVIVSAASRGEFLAVESGGWDVPFQPYALVLIQPADEGWRVTIETSPTPVGAPIWRDQEPIDPNGQTINAPANDETLRAAGYLIGYAVSTWSMPVSRLGLSFGASPGFRSWRSHVAGKWPLTWADADGPERSCVHGLPVLFRSCSGGVEGDGPDRWLDG